MKNLIPHFIEEQLKCDTTHGRFEAYTLFADLSGFTALTQTLTKQGTAGAEELSGILNSIFEPLVQLMYARGGFIPYFAGDSFTAIFPSDQQQSSDLIQTAQQARDLFQEQSFGNFRIGIKIGLGYGNVEWGIVGDELQSFYFRGSGVDRAAMSQVHAEEQEIVLHKSVNTAPSNYKMRAKTAEFFLLETKSYEEVTVCAKVLPELSEDLAAAFLPNPLLHSSTTDEFRTIATVFISFKGIRTHEELDAFATIVLNQIENFSGYFKEIDFGDKGGVMACFFGAPISFENNSQRALEFTWAVKEEVERQALNTVQFRFGITYGMAFTGIVGGKERCQYAAVGNRVNLAARLMTYADWGEVLVDQETQQTRQFKFKHHGNIHYKGIEGDVPTYHLLGQNTQSKFSFTGDLIGRAEEMRELLGFSKALFKDQKPGIAYVYGEAGIGKSRLAYELLQQLKLERRVNWFVCKADQILRKGLNPFIYFLKDYFEQSPEDTPAQKLTRFEAEFDWLIRDIEELEAVEKHELKRELLRTKSIFAGLLNLQYENSLWTQLDAKGRYRNIIAALSNLFIAEALMHPTVIYLEDGHWFDESSKSFLADFVRRVADYPILLFVTSRYLDDHSKPKLITSEILDENKIQQHELDLNFLSQEAIQGFAEAQLGGTIAPGFHQLLVRTTNGNPFYLEQVIEYFQESNLLLQEADGWHIKDPNIKLSSSINAILTARIDRLSNLVKETVKAAAVIGQEFDLPILTEIMREQEGFIHLNGNAPNVLKEQVKTAEQGQIWQAMNELRYIFKHSLLREAVYSMQLTTRLRELHQLIAEAIERLYESNLKQRYEDLAFHYEQAEIDEKANYYFQMAAEYAQRNFQNKAALKYYDKLLNRLEDKEERTKILLKKGEILELIGQWNNANITYNEALALAQKTGDKELLGLTNVELGDLLLLQGNYEDAHMHLEVGVTFFEYIQNVEGMSKTFGSLGNLYFRQGQYSEAKNYFSKSISMVQAIPNHYPDPQIVANLGLTYMNHGDYDAGIRCLEEQIIRSERQRDKLGLANLYTSLGIVYFEKGNYQTSLECHQKGLKLSEELGDKQITAIAIGCIGRVYERQGDYTKAMENYRFDLKLCKELGDKQGTAIVMGLIGDLYSLRGDFDKAIDYLEQELDLSRELSYQKGIAKAINTLGDVYYYKDNFEVSLKYYNQAIEVTRKIDNKLVLGLSLVEKGRTLLAANLLDEIQAVQAEAMQLAKELGNPDLLFESTILTARFYHKKNKSTQSIILLDQLLKQSLEKDQLADVYYEFSLIQPTIVKHKQKALQLYTELYQSTPHFAFKMRIEALS